MRKRIIQFGLAVISFTFITSAVAQVDKKIVNWYNGGGTGMQTDKAYKKLKSRKSTTVIVAIIDSGIDIEHNDLQGKIWVNTKEIPNNKIDDDKNGYVDDVHGWNFLGNAKGENLGGARLEKARMVKKLQPKYEGIDPKTLTRSEQEEHALYEKLKTEVEDELDNYKAYLKQMPMVEMMLNRVPEMVAKELGKTDYTLKDLEKWKPSDEQGEQMKSFAIEIKKGNITKEIIDEQIAQLREFVDYNYNIDFDDRALIGDNIDDYSDRFYGNSDVEGPDALHGTHVAGIIGAIRGNKLGADGVADNVLLMSLRAVPNGDEQDKDIALAIRYAADNGAQVINMSFGKSYSPNQKEVYEAILYAESKGVLLIHAAGNDAENVDKEPNFPTSMYSFQTKPFDNYLTIGASTNEPKSKLVASFSNYGQKGVDVFAPGYQIYNSVPQSDYKVLQGTSMAAPMVAGVAALLKSYFPSLTMKQIKDVILQSSTSYKGVKVVIPAEKELTDGGDNLVDFATLSTAGGVVNVYNAVKMCQQLEQRN